MPTTASTSTTRRRSTTASKSSRTNTRATQTRSGSSRRRNSARSSSGTRGATRSTPRASTRHRTRSSAPASRERAAQRASDGQRDAIAVLKDQHQEVERLFKEFEGLGDGARQSRRRLMGRIIAGLSRHASIEEQYFYPALRREVSDAVPDVLRALEEHHVVTWELDELDGLDPTDPSFVAKSSLLIDNVRRHVRAEERELFPEVRRALDRNRLRDLGAALESADRVAPTRPHPRTPTTPPANLITDPLAGAVDKARDLVRSARSDR